MSMIMTEYVILGGAALVLMLLSKKNKSGVGKVLFSEYDEARITTTDGEHAVDFVIYGRSEYITVTALSYVPAAPYTNNQPGWDFWFHIGDYKTLAGAKKAAVKAMARFGYKFNQKDLDRI